MLPNNHIPLVYFFKQCQNADHVSGILDQLQKEKKEKTLKKNTKSNSSHKCARCNRMHHHDRYHPCSYDHSNWQDHYHHYDR